MTIDTRIICWKKVHNFYVSVAFIVLVVWGIIIPGIIAMKIRKIRNSLNLANNLKMFGYFYIGIRKRWYFWEILIVPLRKMLIIFCAVLFNSAQNQNKVLIYYF